jgi:hypothetical protein
MYLILTIGVVLIRLIASWLVREAFYIIDEDNYPILANVIAFILSAITIK